MARVNWDEVNFHLEFDNIERTDTLNIPYWREFQKLKTEILDFPTFNFFGADHIEYRLYAHKKDNEIKIIKFGLSEPPIFESEYSKEAYTEACKLVKKLFKGEII